MTFEMGTDQMKQNLPLNVDELANLSLEELRNQVDLAIGQLINPLKMKEQLVTQLKTQITDLERFIEFLQGPGDKMPTAGSCHCTVRQAVAKATDAQHKRLNAESRNVISLEKKYSMFGHELR